MFLGVLLFFDGGLLAIGNVSHNLGIYDFSSIGSRTNCHSTVSYIRMFLPHHHSLTRQLLFLAGVTFIIGFQKTLVFFARKEKLRGTICFLGGILLVFFKWPILGMIVELFGFLNLFG